MDMPLAFDRLHFDDDWCGFQVTVKANQGGEASASLRKCGTRKPDPFRPSLNATTQVRVCRTARVCGVWCVMCEVCKSWFTWLLLPLVYLSHR